MGKLLERIRTAVDQDRFFVSVHADEQMKERSIELWQVIDGVRSGRLLRERLQARPNPVVEIEQVLADGTVVLAVWAWLGPERTAKLVV
jgi:hypothetical protein